MRTFGRVISWLGRVLGRVFSSRLFWQLAAITAFLYLLNANTPAMLMITLGVIVAVAGIRHKQKDPISRVFSALMALLVGAALVCYGLAGFGLTLVR